MQAFDWAATPLGPADAWPASLRSVVEIMHDCSFPMGALWGDQHHLFCNDPFGEQLGLSAWPDPGLPLHAAWPGFEGVVRRVLAQVRRGQTVGLDERQRREGARLGVPDGWFDMSFAPLRDAQGAIQGALVTPTASGDRATGVRALRDAESRQQFLLMLGEALRPLADPHAIKAAALRALGLHLRADGVEYGEVAPDGTHEVVREDRVWRLSPRRGVLGLAEGEAALAQALRSRRTLVVPDVATAAALSPAERAACAELGIGALVIVPLQTGGASVAGLAVHQTLPRPWSDQDVALIEETAERTCTALAGARTAAKLAVSEELFRSFAENSADVLWISPADHRGLSYVSPSFDAVFGESRHRLLDDPALWPALVVPEDLPAVAEASRRLVAGQTSVAEYRIVRPSDGQVRHIHDTGFPVRGAGGAIERVAGIAADVTDRRTTEAALRRSEERYRTLFDAIDQGFCIVEVMFGDGGAPVDYRFLETNPVFDAQTGLARAVGQTALTLVPDLERWWIETYGAVATTGQSVRFEHDARPMGRCFDVFAARVGGAASRQVAIIFRDITERRRAEEALRQSEARKAFLLSFADAVRPLADPQAITETAMRLLSEHLGANRVVYFGVEASDYVVLGQHTEGVERVQGRYPISLFGPVLFRRLSEGQASVSPDVRGDGLTDFEHMAFARLQVRAYVAVPLVKQGRCVGGLTVHASSPRPWTADEIALIDDVAQRTWAEIERARAFAAVASSEHRFRSLAEGIPQLVWRGADDGRWIWASPQWTVFTGQSEADSLDWGWIAKVHPGDRDSVRAAWKRAGGAGLFEVEMRLQGRADGGYRWFQTRALPVSDPCGDVVEWLGTCTDVQDLREMQERLTALVAELQHRTRNLMAVVTSVTDRTLASTPSLDAFRASIQSRLGLISRASGLLSRLEGDARVTFDELLQAVLWGHGIDPAAAGQVRLTGPAAVRLRSSSVQTLALALHELAGDALRHGALSVPGGHLSVAWAIAGGDNGQRRLAIDWTEAAEPRAGDPLPAQAERDRQFGRELVERALPYQLNAVTRYEPSPAGLRCHISLPLSA
jgi:PAS domain S-box-containing protein